MTARVLTIPAAIAAAIAVAGCGGGGGGATEDALSFMPSDAPVVFTLDTDADGEQWNRVDKLLGKFPFAGQVRSQLKQSLSSGSGVDFDQDIKPVLGNPVVFAVPTTEALQQDDSNVIGALKVEDEGKAEELVKKGSQKVGTIEGADVYKSDNETVSALTDGVLVIADNEADLEAALKRHAGDDHMDEDAFEQLTAGVEGDGLLKVGVDAEQAINADPEAAKAKEVKWVAGLRKVGMVVSAEEDGIVTDFEVTTEGLAEEDLPLASGEETAPVVRRATDFGFGARNFAQTFRFLESVGFTTGEPGEVAEYKKDKARLNKDLGIDLDRDVVGQFEGDASLSVGLDGGFALRSELADPAAARATLEKATPRLKKAFAKENVGIVTPKRPDGVYAVATADGEKFVFAVRDDKFVMATDAGRLEEFAAQSATQVPDAKGSFVMAADARTIANEVARQQGQNAAALFTGSLGDVTGWVETETDSMSGRFKITIK